MRSRLQHLPPAGAVAAVGVWVCYVSFTQRPADAFLFPRLISAVFVLLSSIMLVQAVSRRANPEGGLNRKQVANLLPGLAAILAHVFWAAKTLGFYTATTIAFFIVLSLYDPRSHKSSRVWARRVAVTAGFIAVLYCLFALLLRVHTPKGIFF